MNATITVNRTELASALAFASLGLAKHPVVPVLTAMKVTVTSGTLRLGAFDYETCATADLSGDGDGNAEILVFAADLAAAVRSLPVLGRQLTAAVTVDAEGLVIICDDWQVNVDAVPAEAVAEYPKFPDLPAPVGTAAGGVFAQAATRISAYASTDDTLPVITRVLLVTTARKLQMVATDRYRLGVDTQLITGGVKGSAQVPADLLAKYAKACDQAGKVTVHMGAEFVGFSDGARTLITRIGHGEFIRFNDKIGGEYTSVITVNAQELLKVVTRAGKVTGKGEPMTLKASAAGVRVTALSGGKVAGTQLVPAKLSGPERETGFFHGYLGPLLAGINGEARIELPENPNRPVRVKSADGLTAILMPLRISA